MSAALDELPGLPRDDDGPAFREPWEARAVAVILRLHARGLFTWREWTSVLAAENAAAGGASDDRSSYAHWLAALERLLVAKGAISSAELDRRTEQWRQAHRETPHGHPVELARAARRPDPQ